MKFRLTVVENTPLTPMKDMDTVLIEFLSMIEYLPKGYRPRSAAISTKDSIPYRLFKEHLLFRTDRTWTVDELAASLGTSRVTIYRHMKKLLGLGLVERKERKVEAENGSVTLIAYRLCQADLLKAWLGVEENINNAVRNYRTTVEHIKALSTKKVTK